MRALDTRNGGAICLIAAICTLCAVSMLGIRARAAEPATAPTPADIMNFPAATERMALTPEQEAKFRQVRLARASSALSDLDAAETPEKRFYALPDAAMGAFYLDRYPQAAQLAAESLEKAETFRNDWNYGNAVHRAHTVRGLLALRDGDIARAVAEMHEAGATPGSPQLNSFGPSMALAKGLLGVGQSKEVLGYLEQCRSFWKSGETWLALWEDKIRAGATPNFIMNLW
jgi:hypothetical protein